MKKYQARKVLSVLLTLLMVLSSINVGLSVIAFAAEPVDLPTANAATGTELSNGQLYTVTTDVTITGGKNGLNIPANATVIIDIAEGETLTVNGSAAPGAAVGKACIVMNSGAFLMTLANSEPEAAMALKFQCLGNALFYYFFISFLISYL